MIYARIGEPIDLTVCDDELTLAVRSALSDVRRQHAEAKARLDAEFPFQEDET